MPASGLHELLRLAYFRAKVLALRPATLPLPVRADADLSHLPILR